MVHTALTNALGNYALSGVALGAYSLSVSDPSGSTLTGYHQGTNPALDSDINPTTGLASGTLTAANPTVAIDAGFVAMAGTSTSLTASTSNSFAGMAVTFTATVNYTGFGPPSGTVTFFDGTTALGTAALGQGAGANQATFTTSSLSVGSHPITAVYGGSSTFGGSTSPVLTQTVQQASTILMLATGSSSSTYGQAVTFTAWVYASTQNVPPLGTVSYYDNGVLLAVETLDADISGYRAVLVTSGLSVGSHRITAVYGGDSNFSGSNAGLDFTVLP